MVSAVTKGAKNIARREARAARGGTPNEKNLEAQSNNLAADSAYAAQVAALNRALENFQANQALGADIQGQDYSKGLRNLGWNAGTGQWDVEDKYQGYGGATNAARQNYAGRGMLRSSGYGTTRANINRSFGEQKTGMDQSMQNFRTQQARDLAQYSTENKDAQLLAREAAIQRRRQALLSGLTL